MPFMNCLAWCMQHNQIISGRKEEIQAVKIITNMDELMMMSSFAINEVKKNCNSDISAT